MKTKILATLFVAAAVTTAAYAYTQDCPNIGQRGMMGSGYGMHQGMYNNKGMMMDQKNTYGYGMHKGMMNQQGMQGYMNQNMMHGYGMNQGMHGFGMFMFSGIDLTDEQSYKLSILRDEMHLNMKKLMGPNPQQHHMINFVSDKGFDKDSFIKEMESRHQQMLKLRTEHFEKVFKILTPEQIDELKKSLKTK